MILLDDKMRKYIVDEMKLFKDDQYFLLLNKLNQLKLKVQELERDQRNRPSAQL